MKALKENLARPSNGKNSIVMATLAALALALSPNTAEARNPKPNNAGTASSVPSDNPHHIDHLIKRDGLKMPIDFFTRFHVTGLLKRIQMKNRSIDFGVAAEYAPVFNLMNPKNGMVFAGPQVD